VDTSVHFRVATGITLGAPALMENRGTWSFDFLTDVGSQHAGYAVEHDFGIYNHAVTVSWPILIGNDREATGQTLICRTYGTSSVTSGTECRTSGGHRFQVTVDETSDDSSRQHWARWDVRITDGDVKRLAEASGSIKTDGSVKLDGSYLAPEKAYQTESRLRIDGVDVVPMNSLTQFDAVLTTDDLERPKKPKEPETARMKFRYAILDASQPDRSIPQYYVRGDVFNHRGGKFTGGSSCEIVDYLDNPVEDSGYTCTMDGYYAGAINTAGRAHYITDFTVSKK
jgi:hypothetical protein